MLHQITILGSGTSTGLPVTGCHCAVCSSTNPKNNRLRTSAFLKTASNTHILIDTSTDLRQQCLRYGIEHIDAAIITHEHADHLHGIDDLRPFCFFGEKKFIPLYSDTDTISAIRHRFPYIFQNKRPSLGGGIPQLTLHTITPGEKTEIAKEKFEFFHLPHGHLQSLCFIHDKLGYMIDCASIPSNVIDTFKKKQLDLIIIDCLRYKPHQTHLHLDLALSYLEEMAPKKAGLIHFSHHFEHEKLAQEMYNRYGEQIFPLYDGQVLTYGSCGVQTYGTTNTF